MDSEEDSVCRGNVSCKTAVSKVTLRPTPRDDRARFACEAEHPAIGAAQMRVAVVLSVQCECKERKIALSRNDLFSPVLFACIAHYMLLQKSLS